MTIRIMRSTFTVAASAASVSYTSDITQADLEAAVPVGGSIKPFALYFNESGGTSDVTLESIVQGNTKNDEGKLNMLPSGDGVSVANLTKLTEADGGGISRKTFPVSLGARLSIVASNAVASARTVNILWKVHNKCCDDC